jgi:hypothetical protein
MLPAHEPMHDGMRDLVGDCELVIVVVRMDEAHMQFLALARGESAVAAVVEGGGAVVVHEVDRLAREPIAKPHQREDAGGEQIRARVAIQIKVPEVVGPAEVAVPVPRQDVAVPR